MVGGCRDSGGDGKQISLGQSLFYSVSEPHKKNPLIMGITEGHILKTPVVLAFSVVGGTGFELVPPPVFSIS